MRGAVGRSWSWPSSAGRTTSSSCENSTDTRALTVLKYWGVDFTLMTVVYEKQDTESLSSSFARQCGVTPNDIVKTMVFKFGQEVPCIVLMHGDRAVCAKKLAALLGMGVKKVKPADAETAETYTGYQFGGTSPFDLKSALLIYIEHSIQEREWVIVNAGSRSLGVRLKTRDLIDIIRPYSVNVAKD